VLPEFRRRGIQQALIAARLNYAAARGARLATIGSKPGAGTERNVRRMGFATAYTKPVMVRPGPGLVGHVS
jgi:GNAT superfamily N-acetyltransferase